MGQLIKQELLPVGINVWAEKCNLSLKPYKGSCAYQQQQMTNNKSYEVHPSKAVRYRKPHFARSNILRLTVVSASVFSAKSRQSFEAKPLVLRKYFAKARSETDNAFLDILDYWYPQHSHQGNTALKPHLCTPIVPPTPRVLLHRPPQQNARSSKLLTPHRRHLYCDTHT